MKDKTSTGKNAIKLFGFVFVIFLSGVPILSQTDVSPFCNSNYQSRFPNELSGFKFYESAQWKPLTFLESTMDDVRRIMGEPNKSVDTAQLQIPYPGDEKALQPVFIYDGEEWDAHIYFGKYCYYTTDLPESYNNRLCEVVLHPKKKIPADKLKFPEVFEKKTKKFPDGSWDEYKDECGLTYIVNYKDSKRKKDKMKYLGNITYGLSKTDLKKINKK